MRTARMWIKPMHGKGSRPPSSMFDILLNYSIVNCSFQLSFLDLKVLSTLTQPIKMTRVAKVTMLNLKMTEPQRIVIVRKNTKLGRRDRGADSLLIRPIQTLISIYRHPELRTCSRLTLVTLGYVV